MQCGYPGATCESSSLRIRVTDPTSSPNASTICFETFINHPAPSTDPDSDTCSRQFQNSLLKELRIRIRNSLKDAWVEVNGARESRATWDSRKVVVPLMRPPPIGGAPIRICLKAPVPFRDFHLALGLPEQAAYNVTLARGESAQCPNISRADCVFRVAIVPFEYAFIPATSSGGGPCCPVCTQHYTYSYRIEADIPSLTGSFSTCPVQKRGLTGYNCYRGATTTCGLPLPTGTSPFNPTHKAMMDVFGQKNTATGACHNRCVNTLTYNWCTANQSLAYTYCC
ncbi:hypothetical protein HYH03_016453 [Edaphochlamys debaryana]|uniref:Uncharacterized protein n=1 Tax=Edaphochlamys debaryana TaxID=47281 RepID=A0A835XK10_9CHLO|nr:hypothetical protein HYH03_016453 [Edaphochlamys debaryana]|eukprot:KAG2484800.1 hypothetical protein HYH03_016453 [Edaphochlamys debaryana]